VRLVLPQELELEHVGPGPWHWAEAEDQGRRLLNVYLESGQTEPFSLVLSGSLGRRQAADPVAVPKFEVLDVASQQGDVVVQIDPAFDVRATDLKNCESILLSRVFGWLEAASGRWPAWRCATPTRLRCSAGDLAAATARQRVHHHQCQGHQHRCRRDDRRRSDRPGRGHPRSRLPDPRRDGAAAHPRALVRQKTIEPAEDGWQRVRLQLQEETLGQYRVLVENDRLLTMADARESMPQQAPIPVLETGRTDQRYRDARRSRPRRTGDRRPREPPTAQPPTSRMAQVGRRPGRWHHASLSGQRREPVARLAYKTVQRATVQTAGAGIGLAETFLIVDPRGAYRGRQTYHVYNTTEAVPRNPIAQRRFAASRGTLDGDGRRRTRQARPGSQCARRPARCASR
jgi:hypothetical protein